MARQCPSVAIFTAPPKLLARFERDALAINPRKGGNDPIVAPPSPAKNNPPSDPPSSPDDDPKTRRRTASTKGQEASLQFEPMMDETYRDPITQEEKKFRPLYADEPETDFSSTHSRASSIHATSSEVEFPDSIFETKREYIVLFVNGYVLRVLRSETGSHVPIATRSVQVDHAHPQEQDRRHR